jgi:hypothetical protein
MTNLKPVTTRVRGARLVMVVAAAALGLVACGSSSSGAGAQAANSAPVQTSAPATTSAPASPPASSAPPSSGGGSFCDYGKAEESQLAAELKAYTADTPAQLEKFEQQALNEAKTFSSSAPPAIKSAIDTAIATDQEFFNELKAVNFDYTKLSPADLAKIQTPAFTKANQTLANYFRTKCGIIATP